MSKTKEHLVLVTETGVVKRLETEEVQKTQNAKTVIKLKSGDRVVSAFCSPGKTDLGISTSDGQFLRIPVSTVSIQGRGAAGIAGMKLKNGKIAQTGHMMKVKNLMIADLIQMEIVFAKDRMDGMRVLETVCGTVQKMF